MEQLTTEVLIIGFGKGGKTLAAYLGKQGIQTVLVEQSEKMYGGTCINIGCIPTKALVIQAERHTPYAQAIDVKDQLTSFLRKNNYDALDNLPSVRIITGKASFISPYQVKISKPLYPDILIEARRIFINTGTVPSIPLIPGLAQSRRIYTSTTLMDEKSLPEKLVIIGGGFISLEYASMYAAYGANVTILDRATAFLSGEDEDIAMEVKKVLESKGIRIINGVTIKHIQAQNHADEVVFETAGKSEAIEADAILMATGRQATTGELNLPAAGVEVNEKGFIMVNEYLQTSQPHIWAIGDVNGGPQFTYISLDDFRIIKDQFTESRVRNTADRKNLGFCVFISPPFAHIGLREKEAMARGVPVKIAKIQARVVPRTRILGQTEGLLKAVIHQETDQILGFTIFCAEAQELINTVRLAMNTGITFTRLKNEIYTHPSMTEALNYFS